MSLYSTHGNKRSVIKIIWYFIKLIFSINLWRNIYWSRLWVGFFQLVFMIILDKLKTGKPIQLSTLCYKFYWNKVYQTCQSVLSVSDWVEWMKLSDSEYKYHSIYDFMKLNTIFEVNSYTAFTLGQKSSSTSIRSSSISVLW